MKLIFCFLLMILSCNVAISSDLGSKGPNKQSYSSSYQQKVLERDPNAGIVDVLPKFTLDGRPIIDFCKLDKPIYIGFLMYSDFYFPQGEYRDSDTPEGEYRDSDTIASLLDTLASILAKMRK